MSGDNNNGFGDLSMLELFRMEEQQQSSVLTENLLALEQEPTSEKFLESLMRAAHSLKGAALMVGLEPVIPLAHVMEDCFVAAQKGKLLLTSEHIDLLLKAVDMIGAISNASTPFQEWVEQNRADYDAQLEGLNRIQSSEQAAPEAKADSAETIPETAPDKPQSEIADATSEESIPVVPARPSQDAAGKSDVLRISTEQINQLMGLAGEATMESRWLRGFADSMQVLKRRQVELIAGLDAILNGLDGQQVDLFQEALHEVHSRATDCRQFLGDRLAELEVYERRGSSLASRLHRAVIASRMQPFGDGTGGFPRLVRDVSRKLGKDVSLSIDGERTLVDREILARIESPLNHLLRNAIDHGIEEPEIREALGKNRQGHIRLSAIHISGMLSIVLEDDGQGVDMDRLRQKVVDRGLVSEDMPERLSEEELLEFLFLPSFSTRDQVSEISGRGVGLDVVHDVVREMGGAIRTTSKWGEGTKFYLQLPLTLSVIPSLLVEVANESYAFPLARIETIAEVERSRIEMSEGHQFIDLDGTPIGLVSAAQILGFSQESRDSGLMKMIVLAERSNRYGLVVDKFHGQQDLVVQPLPKQLGKIKDISTAALLEDGSPVLIVDVDDLFRSIDKAISKDQLDNIGMAGVSSETGQRKRILVVDDSITVREVERNLLQAAGYDVRVAVDGMDGWHMLRSEDFDLVVTDIDMPRMDGIELTYQIRSDQGLRHLPVIIVSYKDLEDDRRRGLQAGADYYLTKGSFHDNTLREAVSDLIGEGQP